MIYVRRILPLLCVLVLGCSIPPHVPETSGSTARTADPAPMTALAEQFVKLGLALGVHDGDYVDAYSGPKEWQDEATKVALPLDQIISEAERMARAVRAVPGQSGIDGQRQRFLAKQFSSMAARARVVSGTTYSFDEESRALYDATAPVHDAAYFENILADLQSVLPGDGSLAERVERFREDFVIRPDLLDRVFEAAIGECRKRTLEYIDLPDHETFTVEYVTDKPWSGYNWFQGNARSLIQVNTQFPIQIDRAVDLACHEGYPGHHVYNTLLEMNLLKDRGWIEFSVFPLFSPTGLIAEGSANYGIDMVFSDEERLKFEESVVFPLAELDASRVGEYYNVQDMLSKLKYAGNFTARRYLDGEIDADQAAAELERYALMRSDKAAQRVKFIDKYRSYVINYNLGRDLVADWVERGAASDAERWARFERLLSQPTLPSGLVSE